jgi:hypothetical protein
MVDVGRISIQELSERYGVNPKTVIKWKKRDFVHATPMGPKHVRSSVLSKEEEALIVAFWERARPLPSYGLLSSNSPSLLRDNRISIRSLCTHRGEIAMEPCAALPQNSICHQPFHGAGPRVVCTHAKIGKALRNMPPGFSVKDANEHSMLCSVDPRYDA